MTIFSGVIVYLMIFWTVLFMILPWGNRRAENHQEGNAASAPANPRIKQKFMITALVSVFIWCIIAYLIHIEVIDFYEISRQMIAEDNAQ